MDDFSTPGFSNAFGFAPSPSNFIWPFKRPLSSSSPVIVVDDDGLVQFVAGASGGSKITTATAQVLLNVLSFCKSVRDAVDMPRIHHQLLPVWISGERDYPQSRTDELESIGHYWNYTSTNGVVQAIARCGHHPCLCMLVFHSVCVCVFACVWHGIVYMMFMFFVRLLSEQIWLIRRRGRFACTECVLALSFIMILPEV